ncbi:MAG: 1-acyl-sn-glycerol-3-phosphate acyltransferase [Gemmatimonadota bacterium]
MTRSLVIAAIIVLLALLTWRITSHWLDRAAARTVYRFRARVDRFKLTRKHLIVAELLRDPVIAAAVRQHATEQQVSEDATWRRVHQYLDEIIPFFNILAYYRLGYVVSRALLNLFYKVTVHHERADPFRSIPKDAIIVYLMNHRSNADYVLVSYALAGDVAISYAVGEWARAFPLEYLVKSFGSYFIRRRYREPLYHCVLERYVQLITQKGVTQGIFPEGGLTRDGALQRAKIGLLDYMIGVARDPACRARMYIVPVAINYDRVLEDRSLLRELETKSGTMRRPSRLAQIYEVARYVWWNALRMVFRRWQRYGRAAVVIGEPAPINRWLGEMEERGVKLFEVDRVARLGHVQTFADQMMHKIGTLVPVTPVCLACAALETFPSDYVDAGRLLERMDELRHVLVDRQAHVIRQDMAISEVFARASRMLRMRRIVARQGGGYVVLPRGRPLIHYYANSIRHLCGPALSRLTRDEALPVDQAIGAIPAPDRA